MSANYVASGKLFNLIISHYLNDSNSSTCIEPLQIPLELLKYAHEFNLNVFKGTGYISYHPETLFKAEDLKKLDELKWKFAGIKKEIEFKRAELEFKTDQEISTAYKGYMETLHRYNEAKDKAQALIGRLAQLSGITTKDLYPKFDLSFDD